MTIHSLKVGVSNCFYRRDWSNFNLMDLRKSYLFDKEFGFATNYVNTELQITYPSFPSGNCQKKQLE